MGNNKKQERKHLSWSIGQKVEILQKLDHGVFVWCLTEDYDVRITTIFDLNKQKHKVLTFYSDSDDPVLIESVRQRRSEHSMPLSGLTVMKQARKYHKELTKHWTLVRRMAAEI